MTYKDAAGQGLNPVTNVRSGKTVSATPTLDSTAAYASGDCLHTTVLSFTDVVRTTGGSGFVDKMLIIEKAVTRTISGNTLANPTVVTTTAPHGLASGETVTISGSNSTPTIDGDRVVTVISATTFSVPVNVTVAGTTGTMVAAARSQVCELWLFNDVVTPAAANAVHTISDADVAKTEGVVSSGPYYTSNRASVSVAKGYGLPIRCVGTTLYGILVTRAAVTYATDSLTVVLQVTQD